MKPTSPPKRLRARGLLTALAVLLVVYVAASLRRLEAGDAMLVIDAPALGLTPRLVEPGWRLVPRLVGRVSTYPRGRTRLKVPLSGVRAARTREGAAVQVEAEVAYSIPPESVLDLHRARGPAFEAEWLEPLVRSEVAARIADVPYDVVRNDDPDLAAALRSGIEALAAPAGVRVHTARLHGVRLAQGTTPMAAAGEILKVASAPVDRRLVILGVDSFDWRLIDPLMKQGRMPAMAELVRRGVRANLRTIRPLLSPLIWTSVATGVKPSRHGIADFVVTARDTGALVPVTSAMRRSPALWSLASRQGIDVSVIAWWATWPAEPVNGAIVTDRVAFQLFRESVRDDWKSVDPVARRGKTHPPELFDAIVGFIRAPAEVTEEEVGWFLPGGRFPARATDGQRKLLDTFRAVIAAGESYHAIALRQLATGARLHMIYYEGPDEASHLFMRYRPPRLEGVDPADMELFGGIVERYYERQDRYIGEILRAAGADATVILLSDHGFKSDTNRPPRSDPRIGNAEAAEWHTPVGVLAMAGPGVRVGADLEAASVLDITPTALALFGLPAARDMDGQPLAGALETEFLEKHPIAWIDSYGGERDTAEAIAQAGAADAGSSSGDNAEVIEKLRSLGYIGEDRLTAPNNRGLMALDEGDLDGAVAEFEKALSLRGEAGAMVRSNLARAWLARGDLDKARGYAEQALAADPRGKQAMLILAGADIKQGDLIGAERHLRRALEVDPTFVQARAKFGEVLQKRGEDDAALEQFRLAVEIAPLSPIEHNHIGSILRRRGDRAGAMKAYRDALAADPQHIGAYNNLGLCLQEEGRLAEARGLYEKALAIRPENPILRNSLGTLLAMQGDSDGAVAQVERAVRADPSWPVAVGNLATLHFEAGRPDQALPLFERWVHLEPTSVEARLGLGLTLLMARRRDEAVAAFEQVLRVDADNVRAHIALGETLMRVGDLEEAQRHLESAARLDPRIARVQASLGEVYRRRGLEKEAARALSRSRELQR